MKIEQTLAANGGNFQHLLEKGVDTATAVAHHTINAISDAARPAVDRVGLTASHAAGSLGVHGNQLNDQGKRMVERAEGYVRQNPVASLGMAVTAGYFLSRLLSSR